MGFMDLIGLGEASSAQRRPQSAARRQAAGQHKTPSRRTVPDSVPAPDSVPPAPSTPAGKYGPDVIVAMDKMPAVRGLLSAHNSSSIGLVVPKPFQDFLVAVKLDGNTARIFYDPLHAEKVTKFFAPMQSALAEAGMSTGGTEHQAAAEIIRQVRLSLESQEKKSLGGPKSEAASMFREWAQLAFKERATDIHLRIRDGGKGEVMMRVDGVLEPIPGSNQGVFTERDVLNAMKAAYSDLSDRHSNSQGAFSENTTLASMIDSALNIPNLRLRFASLRGLYGPKAVCRLLPTYPGAKAMSFLEMGFAPSHIDMFRRAQRLQSGGIAQMGVTGSGKTTAAKTFVETHPGYGTLAMYQVADPIEYPIDQMHQIYVQRSLIDAAAAGKKDPFTETMEALMRTDPDFVDCGEVRDALSARAAANIAKSGHTALFTLHVDSIAGAINRLTDPNLGLSRQELTSSRLIGMLCYQALAPMLCPHCKLNGREFLQFCDANAKDERLAEEARYVRWVQKILAGKFKYDPSNFRFRNPQGCEHCRKRGTKGLTICAEMLMPDDQWLELSAKGQDRDASLHWRRTNSDCDPLSADMNGKLVCEHAMYKAFLGQIDPREIERFTQLDSFLPMGDLRPTGAMR